MSEKWETKIQEPMKKFYFDNGWVKFMESMDKAEEKLWQPKAKAL